MLEGVSHVAFEGFEGAFEFAEVALMATLHELPEAGEVREDDVLAGGG